jgi:hypothetical protein
MQKLNPRYGRIVVPMLLTFFMTAIVSGISTFIAAGPNMEALRLWPGAWIASWFVAFPAALFMLPFSQWLARFIVRKD